MVSVASDSSASFDPKANVMYESPGGTYFHTVLNKKIIVLSPHESA